MRKVPTGTVFNATDLSTFLECGHQTLLELAALEGRIERPGQNEIERLRLQLRGNEHERRILDRYQASGREVVAIAAQPGAEGWARANGETLAAMARGADIIYQGILIQGDWTGRPDFLEKVAGGGGRWPHHYEPVDAKLAREAKARAVLQLCVYADQLGTIQGVVPKHFHIVPGGASAEPIRLLTANFAAYYRSVRGRYQRFVASDTNAPYPEPIAHCDVCSWWRRCEDQRRADDHLSLVANITRRQRDRLTTAGVDHVVGLGALAPDRGIEGIADSSLTRIRMQARLQVEARTTGRMDFKLLTPADPAVGLEALPVPTPGDLFFDIEGDAFVEGEGLEYLFGLVELGTPEFDWVVRKTPGTPRYHAWWATDRASEKVAFEALVDRIVHGHTEFHGLHVFHYGHRENTALKQLSCLHKTREAEVDQLLKDHVLVDLLAVVRHGVLASVESYSLKQLEPLHGFQRKTDLREGKHAMALYGLWLDNRDPDLDASRLKTLIQGYNEDDCLSTWRLRDWLEARRGDLEGLIGRPLQRPVWETSTTSPERTAKNELTAALVGRLLANLPDDPVTNGPAERGRRLMANLLDWHWREAKSGYWEHFRAQELAPDDRLDDRAALGGLGYAGVIKSGKTSDVHAYTFPEQEHAIRKKPLPVDPDTKASAGTPVEIGPNHIHLKRGKPRAGRNVPHPRSLIPGKPLETRAHAESLLALGKSLLDGEPRAPFLAATNLLLGMRPEADLSTGSLVLEGESVEAALSRLAGGPDGSVLAVQGPPGSGKTHHAALLILGLVQAGKRVGVTANSHAVILGVLGKVRALAGAGGVRVLHLGDEDELDGLAPGVEMSKDKPGSLQRLAARELDVVGGTGWTWAAEPFVGSIDVLVVDEAGQVSLANALAVARAAKSLVLLGDPAQLEQPQKGVHPAGADVSALEHLLGDDHLTIPPDRGVFLPHTRRLHPQICDFISAVFYEGRLRPTEGLGLENQRIDGPGIFQGAGLRFVPVAHQGNTNLSAEEVAAVSALVKHLLSAPATFTDRDNKTRPLGEADILVVAPYNAQVAALRRVLPEGVLVGTVDKFQGKEAPVVVYSMASSSAEDAPKGLEFLCSLNRLNVAISRAQALAVLVASPELPRVSCKTPRQMKLVNALCTYIEMAQATDTR